MAALGASFWWRVWRALKWDSVRTRITLGDKKGDKTITNFETSESVILQAYRPLQRSESGIDVLVEAAEGADLTKEDRAAFGVLCGMHEG